MTAILPVLFDACWGVVGFLALRWVARRVFSTPRDASVFAICVVAAFLTGAVWPFSDRLPRAPENAAVAVSPPVEPAAPPPAPVVAAKAADASARCRAIGAVAAPSAVVPGFIDVIGQVSNGHIVAAKDGFSIARGGRLFVSGWAADGSAKLPVRSVCLVVDGKLRTDAVVTVGLPRADVGAALQSDALNVAGYSITLDTGTLPQGVHTLAIAAVTSSGASLLKQQATFTVQ